MLHHFCDGPQLICIAPHLVEKVWPSVVHLIGNALTASDSDLTAACIKAKIDAEKSMLWIVWDTALLAAGTTEIVVLENGRRIWVITAAGGRFMSAWKHLLSEMETHARNAGCEAVRFTGRAGWARYFRDQGYKQPYIVVEKGLR